MLYAAVFAAGVLTGIGLVIGGIMLLIAWQEAKLDMARAGVEE